MSKNDFETGETLITPHIEIGKGIDHSPNDMAYLNVETFKKCLGRLIAPRDLIHPTEPFYSVYGVVSRPIRAMESYVNIDEAPLSRTLMGYLEEEILRKNLPNTCMLFNVR